MTKNTITLTFTTDNADAATIRNTVRRAFDKAEIDGDKGEIKGVKYQVKTRKPRATKVPVESLSDKVRAFGAANGFEVKGRGRLSHDLVTAYNTANPDAVYGTTSPKSKGKTASNVAAIRAWAQSAGLSVGARGRIKPEIVLAFTEAQKTEKVSA